MSFLFGRPETQMRALGDTQNQLIPSRSRTAGTATVTPTSALNSSAVWAALRLRADIVSTMPVNTFRRVSDGLLAQVPSSPFLDDPAGDGYGLEDWLYCSEMELGRNGNAVGLITARDGYGFPSQVEWQDFAKVTVTGRGSRIVSWKIGGVTYDPAEVWHERCHVIAGMPLGLSPIMHGALAIGSGQSAAQFGLDWFVNGAVPGTVLKNMAQTLDADDAATMKQRYKVAVENRDVFVTGSDWTVEMSEVKANESQFLDTMKFTVLEIARFLGVPGDMLDADAGTHSRITYANITQKNLQALVWNFGPMLVRRERVISRRAVPKPRIVRFATEELLRMDTQTRTAMLAQLVMARLRAPSEVRAMDNLPPFTAYQIAEFAQVDPPTVLPAPAAPAEQGPPGKEGD